MEPISDPRLAGISGHLVYVRNKKDLPAHPDPGYNYNGLLAELYYKNEDRLHNIKRKFQTLVVLHEKINFSRFLEITEVIQRRPGGYELRRFKKEVRLIHLRRKDRNNGINSFELNESINTNYGRPIFECINSVPGHLQYTLYK